MIIASYSILTPYFILSKTQFTAACKAANTRRMQFPPVLVNIAPKFSPKKQDPKAEALADPAYKISYGKP